MVRAAYSAAKCAAEYAQAAKANPAETPQEKRRRQQRAIAAWKASSVLMRAALAALAENPPERPESVSCRRAP